MTLYAKRNKHSFDGLMYIMTALDVCTANDEMANEAFDVYVRLFYKIDDNEQLRKKIIEMLSPISTMANAVRIKLSTKTERFFEIAEGQDIEKTKVYRTAII